MNISSNFIAHYSMFNCHLGGLQSAISAFPLLVGDDGFVKMPLFKVRPQGLGHPNLGISDLPQEKITDSQFAAGSTQQIGIRLAGSIKMHSEMLFGDAAVIVCGLSAIAQETINGIDHFGGTAILQQTSESHAC